MELKYYSFFYCMMHDDGFIINGNHPYVSEGYIMKHSDACELCDWCNMGVIMIDDDNIEIIETVRLNYDRYGGGFTFYHYSDTLSNEKGESIVMDENSVLNKWIIDMKNNDTDDYVN